jgi:hypothetical protein
MTSSVQDMSLYHRCADVFVIQKLLDGANVITGFEQMGDKGVAKSVAADSFDDPCFPYCFFYRALEDSCMDVMAPLLTC